MRRISTLLLFRDIKRSLMVFIAIAMIVMPGTTLYSGIVFASEGLLGSIDAYLQETDTFTHRLSAERGFTQADVDAVSALPEVNRVEGGYGTAAYMAMGEGCDLRTVSVLSLTETISRAELHSGRMPQAANECVAEISLEEWVSLGDTLTLTEENESGYALLGDTAFVVTGFVTHPESALDVEERRGVSPLGNGCVENFVFVLPEAFNQRLLNGRFLTLYVMAQSPANTFSAEYAAQSARVKEALLSLNDAWSVQERSETLLCIGAEIAADNLDQLGASFGLIFLIISAMICYTSLGRRVMEQQRMLGLQKAQGVSAMALLWHYLAYAALATLLGVLPGIALGYGVLQPMLVEGYLTNYRLTVFASAFEESAVFIALGAAMLINLCATAPAVWRTLRLGACELMRSRGQVVKPIARADRLLRRFSLKGSMAVRNMLINPERTLTTILSTAGCMTLILLGVALKFAMEEIPRAQFTRLVRYDHVLTVDARRGDVGEAEALLASMADVQALPLRACAGVFRFGEHSNMASIAVADAAQLNDYFALIDPASGQPITLPEDGALLSVRTCEHFGIKVGDELTFTEGDGTEYTLRVGGIMDNYIDHFLCMSPAYYQQVAGKTANINQFYLKNGTLREDELRSAVSALPCFVSLLPYNYKLGQFTDLAGTMNMIMALMIGLSALLALVTLFNLSAMTMLQKRYEMNVMRANGFTVREVKAHITGESRVMTAMGIVLGAFVGSGLLVFVKSALESDTIKMGDTISLPAVLISGMATLVIAEVVQAIFLLRVKRMRLSRADD